MNQARHDLARLVAGGDGLARSTPRRAHHFVTRAHGLVKLGE
jgi:hypothetical protein